MVLKGEYPPHTGNVLMTRAIFILGASFMERFAYYTMTGSITTFFTRELKMTSVFAQQMQSIFASMVYILPVASAVITDQWAGRWIMALSSYAGYVPGGVVLTLGAYYKIDWLSLLSYYCLFAIPAAFIKPNLVTLGADQFDARNIDQLRQRGHFFGAQYWVTNIAAALAFLVMSDVAVSGMGAISADFGFTFTFIIGTVCLAVGFLVLFSGFKVLYSAKPAGSPLGFFFRVTGAAVSGKHDGKRNWSGIWVLIGLVGLIVSVFLAIVTYFYTEEWLIYTVAALIILNMIVLIYFGQDSTWVEQAALKHPGKFTDSEVDGVRCVYALCPYIGFAIPFWAVYNQMYTSFISQGCQMQYVFNGKSYAPQTMTTYNSVVIVIFIPIFNMLIYPMSQKLAGGKFALTPLRRFGCGLLIAAVAMIVASILEYARKAAPIVQVECGVEEIALHWCTTEQLGTMVDQQSVCYDYDPNGANSEFAPVHDFNIYIQIVIYGLVGLGEIMVAITIWDFFYSQVPPYMRTVCQSIQLLTTSLGTLVSGVINSVCVSFLPNNLDKGSQDIMYYINAGLAVFCLFFFVFVSRGFVYKPGTSFFPWDDKDETTLATEAAKKELIIARMEANPVTLGDIVEEIVEEIIEEAEEIIEDVTDALKV